MTVVVATSTVVDAFVVADCRLTQQHQGRTRIRDVCQKLFGIDHWAVVGLSGDLCLARELAAGVVRRLRETNPSDPDWLIDRDRFHAFILEGIRFHGRVGTHHAECAARSAGVLVAWMDFSRMSPSGEWRDGPPAPEARIISSRSNGRRLDTRATIPGTDCIGRAPSFAQDLHSEAFAELATYFGRYDDPPAVRDAQRALIATAEVQKRLEQTKRTGGVGGLYQVMTLGPAGVRPVPYFQLVEVEPGFKTYVAMRIDRGEWVQEHRPSNLVMRVRSPFAIDPRQPFRTDSAFDVRTRLDRHSPGIVPAMPAETVFSLYDPPRVPDAVRPSWGNAPLPILSWGAS